MISLKSLLASRGLLTACLLPTEIDALLSALEVQDPVPQTSPADGFVNSASIPPSAFFALNVKPPGPAIPFHLEEGLAPQARFRVWLKLSGTPAAKGYALCIPTATPRRSQTANVDFRSCLPCHVCCATKTNKATSSLVRALAAFD
jgi:hypothetical protein